MKVDYTFSSNEELENIIRMEEETVRFLRGIQEHSIPVVYTEAFGLTVLMVMRVGRQYQLDAVSINRDNIENALEVVRLWARVYASHLYYVGYEEFIAYQKNGARWCPDLCSTLGRTYNVLDYWVGSWGFESSKENQLLGILRDPDIDWEDEEEEA